MVSTAAMRRVIMLSSGGIRLPADAAALRAKVARNLIAYSYDEALEIIFLSARLGSRRAQAAGTLPDTRWAWRAVGPRLPSRTPAGVVWLVGEMTSPFFAWRLLRSPCTLLFVTMPHSGFLVTLAARLRTVPVLVRLPGFTSAVMAAKRRPSLLVRAVAALEGALMRRADIVSSVCEYAAGVALQKGVPPSRIVVVGGPSVVPAEADGEVEPPAASGGGVRALCVARLTPEKGLRHAIEAVGLARSRGLDCSIRIAGEGPLRAELERVCVESGLDADSVLVGWADRPALAELYRWSSVLVCPSLCAEGICNVGIEGGFFCRPVIGTGLGGMGDYLHHNATGLVVPPGDTEAIADALFLLATPGVSDALGRANRAAALTHVGKRAARLAELRRRLDTLLGDCDPDD